MRAPRNFASQTYEDKLDAFSYEAMAEAAASLGALGDRIENKLASLREMPNSAQGRPALVAELQSDVFAFLVQRELVGFRDQEAVVAQYRIPQEVLLGLGAHQNNR